MYFKNGFIVFVSALIFLSKFDFTECFLDALEGVLPGGESVIHKSFSQAHDGLHKIEKVIIPKYREKSDHSGDDGLNLDLGDLFKGGDKLGELEKLLKGLEGDEKDELLKRLKGHNEEDLDEFLKQLKGHGKGKEEKEEDNKYKKKDSETKADEKIVKEDKTEEHKDDKGKPKDKEVKKIIKPIGGTSTEPPKVTGGTKKPARRRRYISANLNQDFPKMNNGPKVNDEDDFLKNHRIHSTGLFARQIINHRLQQLVKHLIEIVKQIYTILLIIDNNM